MNQHQKKKKNYKFIVLGKAAVGKSCLSMRYVFDNFNEEYNPTLQDTFRKEFNINGQEGVLGILLVLFGSGWDVRCQSRNVHYNIVDIYFMIRNIGYCWVRRVRCHARTLDQRRPRFHSRLFYHRPRVVFGNFIHPKPYFQSLQQKVSSNHHRGQQMRPGKSTPSHQKTA